MVFHLGDQLHFRRGDLVVQPGAKTFDTIKKMIPIDTIFAAFFQVVPFNLIVWVQAVVFIGEFLLTLTDRLDVV